MRLSGKVAIITGAGAGQGRAAAVLFAAEGAKLVAADVNVAAARETVEAIREAGGEGVAVECDVASLEANERIVAAAVERWGKLHIFYANAGIVSRWPDGDMGLEKIAPETWHRILAVNLTGVFWGCRCAIPEIARAGGGSVIITASVGALVGQWAHNHAYVASKTALIGLTRNLALEYAARKVRVNCLCPGQVRTEMMADFYNDPAARQRFIDLTPMGRFGEAREIAAVALFLASDDSSFVTGSAITADGGWVAQ
jgi:NAD(P)-dependent dehydrogenase (short-subunit alcohol dehydrogenase family)